MRFIFAIALWMLFSHCSTLKSEKPNVGIGIERLIAKLHAVPVGYRYDLILQDDENFYSAMESDSSFFPEYTLIIGFLPDTTKHYNILYLDPGDDLYPSVRVFSKVGHQIASERVCYIDCSAGDCGNDSCESIIEVIGLSSVRRTIKKVTSQCDSLGNRIAGTKESFRKSDIVMIEPSGLIDFLKEN